jgi:uncharacterized protein YndB with AHSA1/START domain
MSDTVSVSREVAAPPERVWSLVSDLPRMGEWSPENTGGTWVKGTNGPASGARFRGTNAHGKKSWTTNITVDTCERGREFSFEVTAAGFKVARWSYQIEPTTSGSLITETWTDRRGRSPERSASRSAARRMTPSKPGRASKPRSSASPTSPSRAPDSAGPNLSGHGPATTA